MIKSMNECHSNKWAPFCEVIVCTVQYVKRKRKLGRIPWTPPHGMLDKVSYDSINVMIGANTDELIIKNL